MCAAVCCSCIGRVRLLELLAHSTAGGRLWSTMNLPLRSKDRSAAGDCLPSRERALFWVSVKPARLHLPISLWRQRHDRLHPEEAFGHGTLREATSGRRTRIGRDRAECQVGG